MFSPGCLFEYKHDRVYLDFVACNPNDLLLIDGFQLIFFLLTIEIAQLQTNNGKKFFFNRWLVNTACIDLQHWGDCCCVLLGLEPRTFCRQCEAGLLTATVNHLLSNKKSNCL